MVDQAFASTAWCDGAEEVLTTANVVSLIALQQQGTIRLVAPLQRRKNFLDDDSHEKQYVTSTNWCRDEVRCLNKLVSRRNTLPQQNGFATKMVSRRKWFRDDFRAKGPVLCQPKATPWELQR
jgi:hypothetical protein